MYIILLYTIFMNFNVIIMITHKHLVKLKCATGKIINCEPVYTFNYD